MSYYPSPKDTSGVKLEKDIMDLVELLAENTHDIWALQRLKDGWVYGEERIDSLKTHPCLVPYSSLPESEKNYDRNTAVETLKLIKLLGYKVEKADKD